MSARRWWVVLAVLSACAGDDEPAPMPADVPDARVQRDYDASDVDGAWEEHMTGMRDPLDPVETMETPVLDLPLVVARPRGPRSTATIDVRVQDAEGAPIGLVAVSAGGPAVVTSTLGLAHVTEVYGEGLAEVYVFAPGHAIGHARVPIRDGGRSSALLQLVPTLGAHIADVAAASDVVVREPAQPPPLDAGVDAEVELPPQLIALSFASASFENAWGEPAKGTAIVRSALLHTPADAAAVPGGSIAFVDGARVPLAPHLTLEVRVLQGATDLTPVQPLTLSLEWPEDRVPAQDAELSLFRFDPERGAFVAEGTLVRTALGAELSVTKLGHFAIGALAQASRCVQVGARSGGQPLAEASVLARGTTGFASARATTGADGSACVALPADGEQAVIDVLGRAAAGGLVLRQGVMASLAAPVAAPSACDASACASVEVDAQTVLVSCMRGELAAPRPTQWGVSWQLLDVADGLPTPLENGPFCVDVVPGAEVTFVGSTVGGVCVVTRTAGVNGALCGEDGCTDVGAIECCLEREHCDASDAVDDDCDGMVDEGCSCGGGTCPTTIHPNCCTALGGCGALSPYTGACVGSNYLAIDTAACPSIMVPFGNGDVFPALGCCSVATMECGLRSPDSDFGCVTPADAPVLWGAGVTLGSVACTP